MPKPAKPAKLPRAKIVEIDESEINEEIEVPTINADQVEDSNKLAEFLENFGGKEYKVRVDKFNKEDKVWEHVDTFPLDGFEAYETCKRFGGGRYRLTFLNEKGKYVAGGQPQIRIAMQAVPAVAAQAAQVEQDPLKHPLVAMMIASAEKANAQTNELLKVVLARPEPAKSSTIEVLELMEKLKRFEPNDPMKKVQEALLMKMIERGLDGGAGGETGDKSAWQEIVEGLKDAKSLGVFDKILGAQRPAAPAGLRPPQAAPKVSVQIGRDPGPEEPAPMPPASPIMEALRPFAAIFAQKAANGVSSQDAGGYLYDEFCETVIPVIRKNVFAAKFMGDGSLIDYAINAANDPAQVEQLFMLAPELAAHRDWVLATITEAIKVAMTPEEPANAPQA